MPHFTDSAGRTWPVALTVTTLKRVKARLDMQLLDCADVSGPAMRRLGGDVLFLADVLYAILEPECERLGVSAASFSDALAGDVLWHGFRAVTEALADFFPDARQREMFRALVGKVLQLAELEMDKAETAVADLLATSCTSTVGDSPGSPASIPVPTPSAS